MSSNVSAVSAPSENSEEKNSKQNQQIEQYKTYLDMLNHSNEQRIATNQFFVAINVSLVTFLATILKHMFDSGSGNASVLLLLLPLPAVAGYWLSRVWCFLLISYNTVNSARWKVVYDMEKTLAYQPFQSEWEGKGNVKSYETNIPRGFLWLRQAKDTSSKHYYSISGAERELPILFGWLYLIIIVTVSVYSIYMVVVQPLVIKAGNWLSSKNWDILLAWETIKSSDLTWVLGIIAFILVVFVLALAIIALRVIWALTKREEPVKESVEGS